MGIQFNISEDFELKSEPYAGALSEKKKRFSQKRAQTLASIEVSETEKNKPENMSASNCDTANVGAKG